DNFHVPVLTIDLANKTKLTFDDYVNKVATEIENWKNDSFIIVAHSIGALVGLKVAERFNEKLKGFVAIGSFIPKKGQSFASSLPFPQKIVLPILLSLLGTKPPKKSIANEFCIDYRPNTTLKIKINLTLKAKTINTTKLHFDLHNKKRC